MKFDDVLYWDRWRDPYHWLGLWPKGHPEHKNGNGDQPNNTGFWVVLLHYKMKLQKKEFIIPKWFRLGWEARYKKVNGELFVRHPLIDTPMNHDQLKTMVPAATLAGIPQEEIDAVVKEYGGWKFPQQWMHLQRARNKKWWYPIRLVCDFFECIDCVFDWFSDSASSKSKNIVRHAWASDHYPTFLMSLAKWLFVRKVDPYAELKAFFTKSWLPLQPEIWRLGKEVIEDTYGIKIEDAV